MSADTTRLRELLDDDSIPPRPWAATHNGRREVPRVWADDDCLDPVASCRYWLTLDANIPTAQLIVAAVNALPELLDRLEAAEEREKAALDVMNNHRCDEQAERAYKRAALAEAAIERVRELHAPVWECANPRHTDPAVGCPDCAYVCRVCDTLSYPCETLRALDGNALRGGDDQ